MKIETQPLEDRQVKLTVEVEPEILEDYKRRAARKISKDVRIPGFRPGKAPLDLVRRMYGEEAIQQQAVELMVDDIYPKALEEAKLEPSGMGSLDEIVSVDPPKFTFTIPLAPEVKLGDYAAIRKEYEPVSVSEDEVDQFLNRMRRNYATAEPVTDRPAGPGDLVYVTLSGQIVTPGEGEEAIAFPERPAQFLIADEDEEERDWPFPNFAENLKGVNEGDVKTIRHMYDDDQADDALKGKEVEFTVAVQSIKHMTQPDIDDDFAKTVGNFESLENLRDAVRAQLGDNQRAEYDSTWFSALIDDIVAGSEVSFPPHLLEHEQEHVLEHLNQDLGRAGMDFEAYLKMLGKERDAYIEEEIRPAARKRLTRSLVLDEIARTEKVELAPEDFQAAYTSSVSQLGQMPRRGKKDRPSDDTVNALTYDALNRIYNQRILDRLKDLATGVTTPAAGEETPEAPAKKKPASKKKKAEAVAEAQQAEAVAPETAAAEAPAKKKPAARKKKEAAADEPKEE